jgi:endonuclease-3
MNSEKIGAIFERFAAKNPHPETELQYTNSYTLLVAVVLSAQATDIGVNKATKSLFAKVDSPQKMVDLGLDDLKQYIKTIGLFNTKAKNVIALSKILIEKYQGQIPQTREELETLPGVGRKTANVVLNVAFGQPTIAVDTHIFRVANRIGLASGKTPLAIELGLNSVIPSSYLLHVHHWLILHGRYICKAQKPLCSQCPINGLCEFPDKTI